ASVAVLVVLVGTVGRAEPGAVVALVLAAVICVSELLVVICFLAVRHQSLPVVTLSPRVQLTWQDRDHDG
ncbi:MAG TPA: hypothetical protein VGW38_23805, partial [Chloroflexota bacterium]|nr:hypothetical protein [Chloroflexota bacterium]